MNYWFFSLLIVFIGTTFTGIVIVLFTCDFYSGRSQANNRRSRIALDAIEKHCTPLPGLREYLYGSIRADGSRERDEPRVKSLLDWVDATKTANESSPTDEEFHGFYTDLASGTTTALGSPTTTVNEMERITQCQVDLLHKTYPARSTDSLSYLESIRKQTRKVSWVSWIRHQKKVDPDNRPRPWKIFKPELLIFLDAVGRGSTFGLLASTAISLTGLAFGFEVSFASLSTLLIGISASFAGTVHGYSVYVRMPSPHIPRNKFDAWLTVHPWRAYGFLQLQFILLAAAVGMISWFLNNLDK